MSLPFLVWVPDENNDKRRVLAASPGMKGFQVFKILSGPAVIFLSLSLSLRLPVEVAASSGVVAV